MVYCKYGKKWFTMEGLYMKTNWFKRTLCSMLAFVLVLGYVPVKAQAEETAAAEETVETTAATVPETTTETEPETTMETEPVTEPATEQETMPETMPETIPETVPDAEPELLIETEAVQTPDGTGTVIASGFCGANGDNVTYTLTDDGTLTISGTGDMSDYYYPLAPWFGNSQIKSVIIEQGVTSIGGRAFHSCGGLTNVTIPNSVTSIGYYAFNGCSSLTSVTIPDGVTSIGNETFRSCSSLSSVTIPNSVTSIGDQAFQYCENLTSVTIPASVTSIGSAAFYGCSRLTSITIPDGVTSLGYGMFTFCENLTSVTIPASVITIEDSMFYGCSSLKNINVDSNNQYWCSVDGVLFSKDMKTLMAYPGGRAGGYECPNGVVSVHDRAFAYCCGLTSLTIPNSVISIGSRAFEYCGFTSLIIPDSVTSIDEHAFYSCDSLTSVTIPDSVISIDNNAFIGCLSLKDINVDSNNKYWCSVDGVWFSKDMKTLVAYPGGRAGAYNCPDSVISIGDSAFSLCRALTSVTIPNGVTSIGDYAFNSCSSLKDVYYKGTEEQWSQIAIGHSNSSLTNATIHYIWISQYGNGETITINHSGHAYAYYRCAPETTVCFSINGAAKSEQSSDESGIVKVFLGSFDQQGEYTVTVAFTKVGDEDLLPALEFTEKVKVTPFSFTQTWDASLSASVGAGLSEGVGIKVPALEADATLGKVEGEIEGGHALSFSRERSEGKESLEITAKEEIKGGAKVKSGVTGEVLKAEFTPVEASAGVKSGRSGSYGIKFENFSASNVAQQQAVATFLLGEALVATPNNLLLKPFYKRLAESVYANSGCIITEGSGTGINVSAGANLLKLKVNNTNLFTTATGKASAAISMSESTSSNGERSKKTSYKTDTTLAALSGKLLGVKGSVLSRDFLGTDISISAKIDKEGKKSVAASFLSSSVSEPKFLILGAHAQSEYSKYSFKDDTLNGLLSQSKYFGNYLNGSNFVLNQAAILELADELSTCDMPIPYSNEYKDELLYTLPFEFGLALGFEADLGVELSYLEESSYVNKTGFAVDDRQLLTGVSDDLSKELADNSWELTDIFTICVTSLEKSVKNFFKEVTGAIKDGVQDTWSWITEKADSTKDWIITITSASSGSVWAESYSIDAYTLDGFDTVMPEGISSDYTANYELTKAATIGRPFLISVTDRSGNSITDLSSDPLEYTIRYVDADLQAAGLSRNSSIVRNGGIAMYRYSDDGDYFEYVGGTNDLDVMTVTATITKPGQYILAADSCAPTLSSLDVSDYHTNPTITARITDMTGLDFNSFRFILDGQCVVDGTSIADHFNKKTGTFTYTVPENAPLSEGEHSMSFTLSDTSGNAETYTFIFPVDLTAPEIKQYSAEGHPNEGSIVEIKAQVSDTNLTEVCALFSKRLPDGTWTDEVPAEMSDMGDGLWELEYEGGGNSIRVRIQAVDIAGNTAESEIIELAPFAEIVAVSQEYVLLYEGHSTTLKAEVTPAELSRSITWSVEKGGEGIVVVDEAGNVTAQKQGTAYVLASIDDGQKLVSARCRIDVAPRIPIMGVQLGTPAVTTELLKTGYAAFDVILLLEQNKNPVMTADAITPDGAAPEDNGVAIDSAEFVDEKTAAMFDLAVKDDRTLQVVPKQAAIDSPKSVSGKYTSKVRVTVGDEEFTTGTALTLTVKKSTPKLKATALTFNPFYSEQAQAIKITGATVTDIEGKTLPDWLTLENGVLKLAENAPAKASGKVSVRVKTAEWNVLTDLTFSVKAAYAAPKLKLSASSATFAAGEAYKASQGVTLKLQCAGKTDTLESLNVSGIQAPEGFVIQNFDPADGSFILKPTEAVTAGTKEITVSFLGTTQTVILKLKISTKAVSISAKPSTVTLNSVVGDSAAIPLTASPADYQISGVNIRLAGSRGEAIAQDLLAYEYGNGFVIVRTVKGKTQPNTTYKLYVSTKDTAKETVLTVKTLADTKKMKPTVSAKVSGSIDLSFPESCAVVTPVFKNYASGAVKGVNWTVTESKGKTLVGDATAKFNFTPIPEKNQLQLSAKDGLVPGNTYLLSLTYTLADDSTCSCTAKITVKRTPVKLKLSKTSLSLNRKIGDTAVVDVTCLTRGYDFTNPVAALIPPNSKDGQSIDLSQPGTQEPLTVSWSDGKLTVTANSTAEAGKTYKIALRATENDPAVTLSVKILDTAVTTSMKASGTIDVVRNSTSITVTPSYRNYMGLVDIHPQLTIESGNGRIYQSVEAGLFNIVQNGNGTCTITKAPGAKVDTTLKYRAKLTCDNCAKPAYVNLAVKSGTAKVSVSGAPVLYKADRYSRCAFRLTTTDKTLNPIVRTEIRDVKYRNLFEIHSYGNGEFAIGFKDNLVPTGRFPSSVVLNVYADGNSTRSVASVTLKLQVR